MLRLRIELEGKPMGSQALREGENIVGRSRSSSVKVDAPDISRQHLKLTVSGGVVLAENLSQFGTKVDGVPLTGPAPVRPGQKLTIGGITALFIEDVASEMEGKGTAAEPPVSRTRAAAEPEGATVVARGVGVVDSAPADRTEVDPVVAEDDRGDRTGEEPSPGPAAGGGAEPSDAPFATAIAPGSTRSSGTAGDEAGHTRAMQTQMVSPEELEVLRAIEQKRMKNRIILTVAVGVPLLLAAIVLRPKAPPPETEIEWSKDESGRYLDKFVPAPSGGTKEGGFDLMFPGGAEVKVTPIPGGIQVDTRIGRDRDVPFRLVLQEETDKRFLEMSRQAVADDWVAKTKEGGGHWNFDRPIPVLEFYGWEQGIPHIRIPYQREGTESWSGVASIFRNGQRRYVLRAEAPAREKLRAEKFVARKFILPSEEFLRSHWEWSTEIPKASASELVREARLEMARTAPATWSEIDKILRSALAKAAVTDNQESYAEAMDLLKELRRRQAHWFNSQQFARDSAVAEGDFGKAGVIAEMTKGVFSNMEDSRYYQVRRW